MIISSMTKNGSILALFALITTGAVGVIHSLTADNIAEQEQKQLSSQLQAVLDPHFYDNTLYQDCAIIDDPPLVIIHKQFTVRVKMGNQSL